MQTKLKYEIVLKRVNLFQDIDEEKRCQLFEYLCKKYFIILVNPQGDKSITEEILRFPIN